MPTLCLSGMRIKVIAGSTANQITKDTNEWLEVNEKSIVILSISPAIPREHGGYITITYEFLENVFEEKNLATNS